MSSFGAFLKEARVANGLSQGDVAKIFKYTSNQYVSNWERGDSLPPVDIKFTQKLCKLYGMHFDEYVDLHTEAYLFRVKEFRLKVWGLK